MTAEEFVRALRSAIVTSSAREILKHSAALPGRRKKSQAELDLAAWIEALDDVSRKNVEFLIEQMADEVLFGLLCVIDGVRVVGDGAFELSHVDSAGKRSLLNGLEDEFLHDVYRAQFEPLKP